MSCLISEDRAEHQPDVPATSEKSHLIATMKVIVLVTEREHEEVQPSQHGKTLWCAMTIRSSHDISLVTLRYVSVRNLGPDDA